MKTREQEMDWESIPREKSPWRRLHRPVSDWTEPPDCYQVR
jgi:hypothetical protein